MITLRSSREQLINAIETFPVIPAIKSGAGLDMCLESENPVVFLLSDVINDVTNDIKRLKQAGKIVFVHVDLVEGLSAKDASVDFLAARSEADGIISTKPQLVRHAHEIGLLAVQRFFMLDSLSLNNAQKICSTSSADMIEILPGLMPKVIRRICSDFRVSGGASASVVAGGLISEKEDVVAALAAGAMAVSTTNTSVWAM